MALPQRCNLDPLSCDIEGLRRHSMMLNIFMPQPDVTPVARKWRAYLIHCLVKASRHYNEARTLVLQQIQGLPGAGNGAAFPIFDFALVMEDCLTSVFKLARCAHALQSQVASFAEFHSAHRDDLASLEKIRNQQEHIFSQLSSGQTGDGPIFVSLSEDGEWLQLRKLKTPVQAPKHLIEGFFAALMPLYPAFDPSAPPSAPGVPVLTMSLTIEERPGQLEEPPSE